MTVATEQDFEKFFGVAKVHGLTFENCLEIAIIEAGRPLRLFSKEELESFAERICGVNRA